MIHNEAMKLGNPDIIIHSEVMKHIIRNEATKHGKNPDSPTLVPKQSKAHVNKGPWTRPIQTHIHTKSTQSPSPIHRVLFFIPNIPLKYVYYWAELTLPLLFSIAELISFFSCPVQHQAQAGRSSLASSVVLSLAQQGVTTFCKG